MYYTHLYGEIPKLIILLYMVFGITSTLAKGFMQFALVDIVFQMVQSQSVYHIYIWSIPTKVMHIGQKNTLVYNPKFFDLYRRQVELSQKLYAIS